MNTDKAAKAMIDGAVGVPWYGGEQRRWSTDHWEKRECHIWLNAPKLPMSIWWTLVPLEGTLEWAQEQAQAGQECEHLRRPEWVYWHNGSRFCRHPKNARRDTDWGGAGFLQVALLDGRNATGWSIWEPPIQLDALSMAKVALQCYADQDIGGEARRCLRKIKEMGDE